MKITTDTIRKIRIGIEAAFLLTFILLCVAIGVKNKKIMEYKAREKANTEVVDSLKAKCDQLWGMDCITINVIANLQQKGVVNLNQSTQISRSIAELTRGELLMALDSVTNANNTK